MAGKQRYSKPRSHNIPSAEERNIVRRKFRETKWTQKRLAEWASQEFGRPISQSTISDIFRLRADEVTHYEVASRSAELANPYSIVQEESTASFHTSWWERISEEGSYHVGDATSVSNSIDTVRHPLVPWVVSAQISSFPTFQPLDQGSVCRNPSVRDHSPEEGDLFSPTYATSSTGVDLQSPRLSSTDIAPHLSSDTLPFMSAGPNSWEGFGEASDNGDEPAQEYLSLGKITKVSQQRHRKRRPFYRLPPIPPMAPSSTMYLSQFFSGLVGTALNCSDTSLPECMPTAIPDPYTNCLTQVFMRPSCGGRPLAEALRALLLHHAGWTMQDRRIITKSRQFYSRALISVQKAINVGSIDIELVVATIMLTWYDMFNFDADQQGAIAFRSHTRGAAQMMDLLGPEPFMNEYGSRVFVAFRSQYIHSYVVNEGEFLRDPRWADVIAFSWTQPGWEIDGLTAEDYRYADVWLKMNQEYKMLRALILKDPVHRLMFVDRLRNLCATFRDWSLRFLPLLSPPLRRFLEKTGYVSGPSTFEGKPSGGARTVSLWCATLSSLIAMYQLLGHLDPLFDPVNIVAELRVQLIEASKICPVGAMMTEWSIRVSAQECSLVEDYTAEC